MNYYPNNHHHLSIQQQQQDGYYLQYKQHQHHDDYERREHNHYYSNNNINSNNNKSRKPRGVVEEAVASMTQNSAYLHAMEDQRHEFYKLNYHTDSNNNNGVPLDYENRINARFTRYQRRYSLRTTRNNKAAAAAAAALSVPPPTLLSTATMMRPQMLQGVPIPIFNNHYHHHNHHRRIIINSDYPCTNNDIEEECIALPPDQFEDASYSECNVLHSTNILVPFDYDDDTTTTRKNNEEEGILIIGTTIVNDIKYFILQIYNNVLVPYRRSTPFDIPTMDKTVAYWLRNRLHSAIYGRVRYGTMLRYLISPLHVELSTTTMDDDDYDNNNNNVGSSSTATRTTAVTVSYISTGTSVAIKEISWDSISEQGYKLAEDPIKEVAAMQYMYNFVNSNTQQQWTDNINNNNNNNIIVVDDDTTTTTTATTNSNNQQQHPNNHHIMLPIDLLSNEQYLYSITPYYNGGRLLDRIEYKGRLSEVESRYYIHQILLGLAVLKKANVVHRDISPENIMLHDNECYIIDMGMCLRIPTIPSTTPPQATTTTATTVIQQQQQQQQQGRQERLQRSRAMILPQTPCGKWHYLSPEICASVEPFDGPAVDLWAVGIILYIMLTGSPPPWKEPRLSDTNFRLFMDTTTSNTADDDNRNSSGSSSSSGGGGSNLKRILSEENALGLSTDVLDLLQSMLMYNPEDRLCLEQVMNHPWMMNYVSKQ